MVSTSQSNPRGLEADGGAPVCSLFMDTQSKMKVVYYQKLLMHFSTMWFSISKHQLTGAKSSPDTRGFLMNMLLKWFLRSCLGQRGTRDEINL